MLANDALDLNPGGLLSDATLLALQLQHQPFTSQLHSTQSQDEDDTQVIGEPFSDAVTEEQLADVKQALITADDLLLILGEQGSGKTTLLKQLSANSGLRIQCFSVTGSERFSTLNLFAGMLEAFKRKPSEELKEILDELVPNLQAMVARNTLSVVVLDDAHKVSKSELTQLLNSMLYLNGQDETLLRVALSASGDFEEGISELLPEGADLPYSSLTIEGFSTERATAYLQYRLSLAGFSQEFPFTNRDMESLVEHSAGMPAKLHALTADVLNEKHGRLESTLPRELISSEASGFLQSRKGKLALGAIATVLIIGGILMFLPGGEKSPEEDNAQRVVVTEQPVDTQAPGPDASDSTENQTSSTQTAIATAANNTPPRPPEVAAQNPPLDQTGNTEQSADGNADSGESSEASASDTVQSDTSASLGQGEGTANESGSVTLRDTTNNATGSDDDAPETAQTPESEAETAVEEPTGSEDDTQATTAELATAPSDEQLLEPQQEELAGTLQDTDTNEPASFSESAAATESSTADTESAAAADNTIAALLEPPSWIVVQEDNQFTVQMTASRDLPSVENFLRVNQLPRPNSIFSFERNGEIWYALVHGIFASQGEAQLAVERMSAAAQRDQPWIRSISRIKAILR